MTPSEILDELIEMAESRQYDPEEKQRLKFLQSYKELRDAHENNKKVWRFWDGGSTTSNHFFLLQDAKEITEKSLHNSDQLLKSLVNEK